MSSDKGRSRGGANTIQMINFPVTSETVVRKELNKVTLPSQIYVWTFTKNTDNHINDDEAVTFSDLGGDSPKGEMLRVLREVVGEGVKRLETNWKPSSNNNDAKDNTPFIVFLECIQEDEASSDDTGNKKKTKSEVNDDMMEIMKELGLCTAADYAKRKITEDVRRYYLKGLSDRKVVQYRLWLIIREPTIDFAYCLYSIIRENEERMAKEEDSNKRILSDAEYRLGNLWKFVDMNYWLRILDCYRGFSHYTKPENTALFKSTNVGQKHGLGMDHDLHPLNIFNPRFAFMNIPRGADLKAFDVSLYFKDEGSMDEGNQSDEEDSRRTGLVENEEENGEATQEVRGLLSGVFDTVSSSSLSGKRMVLDEEDNDDEGGEEVQLETPLARQATIIIPEYGDRSNDKCISFARPENVLKIQVDRLRFINKRLLPDYFMKHESILNDVQNGVRFHKLQSKRLKKQKKQTGSKRTRLDGDVTKETLDDDEEEDSVHKETLNIIKSSKDSVVSDETAIEDFNNFFNSFTGHKMNPNAVKEVYKERKKAQGNHMEVFDVPDAPPDMNAMSTDLDRIQEVTTETLEVMRSKINEKGKGSTWYRSSAWKMRLWALKEFEDMIDDPNSKLSDMFRKIMLSAKKDDILNFKVCHRLFDPEMTIFGSMIARRMISFEQALWLIGTHSIFLMYLFGRLDAYVEKLRMRWNSISIGNSNTAKSFMFELLIMCSVDGSVEVWSYQTAKANTGEGNRTDLISIFHELSLKNFSVKECSRSSEAAMFKDVLTRLEVTVRYCHIDQSTGKRMTKSVTSRQSGVWFFASNDEYDDLDEAWASRMNWAFCYNLSRADKNFMTMRNVSEFMTQGQKKTSKDVINEYQKEQVLHAIIEKLIHIRVLEEPLLRNSSIYIPIIASKIESDLGIKIHPRVTERMMIFIRKLVISTAIEKLYNIPLKIKNPRASGMMDNFYNKDFEWWHLMYFNEFLHDELEMVIFAFSLFRDQFIPPLEQPLINNLKKMNMELKDKDRFAKQMDKATGQWQPDYSRCTVAGVGLDQLASYLHKCWEGKSKPSDKQIKMALVQMNTRTIITFPFVKNNAPDRGPNDQEVIPDTTASKVKAVMLDVAYYGDKSRPRITMPSAVLYRKERNYAMEMRDIIMAAVSHKYTINGLKYIYGETMEDNPQLFQTVYTKANPSNLIKVHNPAYNHTISRIIMGHVDNEKSVKQIEEDDKKEEEPEDDMNEMIRLHNPFLVDEDMKSFTLLDTDDDSTAVMERLYQLGYRVISKESTTFYHPIFIKLKALETVLQRRETPFAINYPDDYLTLMEEKRVMKQKIDNIQTEAEAQELFGKSFWKLNFVQKLRQEGGSTRVSCPPIPRMQFSDTKNLDQALKIVEGKMPMQVAIDHLTSRSDSRFKEAWVKVNSLANDVDAVETHILPGNKHSDITDDQLVEALAKTTKNLSINTSSIGPNANRFRYTTEFTLTPRSEGTEGIAAKRNKIIDQLGLKKIRERQSDAATIQG